MLTWVEPLPTFYFLRHGESSSNVDDTIAGTMDVPLTARGCEQAVLAAHMLDDVPITRIYTSSLSRARKTAQEVAALKCCPTIVVPDLGERCWGALQGQPRSMRDPGVTPPGAETAAVFRERVTRALNGLDMKGCVLLVSHSGVFREVCALLGIEPPKEQVDNASPVRFTPLARPQSSWRMDFLL